MNALTLGLFAYVGLQLLVGLVVARRVTTEQDYLLAGRRLGPWLGTASVFATWFGAEACVGAAGQVYREGLGPLSVEPFAYGISLLLVGLLLAVPLWRAGVTTFPDFLRARFSVGVERTAALLHIPGSLLWAAAQIRAFGEVLGATAEIEIGVAITVAAAIAIAYTAMGGMLADVVTDLMQGGVLVLGLAVVTFALVVDVGGPSAALELARGGLRAPVDVDGWEVAEAWLIPIGGSLVSQEVLARAMASRSAKVARGSVLAGGGLYLMAGMMPVLVGLIGVGLLPGLENGEQIMPELARRQLHPILYVVFAGALISAILSTVDSALLVAGSLLSRNVLHAGREQVPDRTRLRTARVAVVGFGAIAWVLALRSEGVFELVEEASGFGSAGMVVVLMMGVFGRVGGPRSAAAALATGIVTWVVLRHVLDEFAYPYLVALAASGLAYLIAGLFDRDRARDTR